MSRARDFADLAGAADAGGLTGRNLLVNGDYKIWQRATSSTAANYSGPDRWYYGNAGTYSRSTDVPSGQGFQYSNSVKVTAATTYGVTAQRIEAVNCKHLVGKSVTASFWLKTISGSTSMNCVLYRANTEDGHSSGVTAIETKPFTGVTGTWTYYTLTWDTLPAETANGLQLYFYSTDAGTDPEYRITGVQLEVGEQATPFEHEPYGVTLQKAQRYYSEIGSRGTARSGRLVLMNDSGTTGLWGIHTLPNTMRAEPSVTTLGGGTSGGSFNVIGNNGATTSVSSIASIQNGLNSISGNVQSISSGASGYWIDLGTSSNQLLLTLDAEL